jgi:hypothetical protein
MDFQGGRNKTKAGLNKNNLRRNKIKICRNENQIAFPPFIEARLTGRSSCRRPRR